MGGSPRGIVQFIYMVYYGLPLRRKSIEFNRVEIVKVDRSWDLLICGQLNIASVF